MYASRKPESWMKPLRSLRARSARSVVWKWSMSFCDRSISCFIISRASPPSGALPCAHARGPREPPRTTKTIDLDYERLEGLGIITPDSTESPIAEEHRLIKRPLLMNASLDGNHRIPRGNMILVTSSLPGEGKTFTSINMAISTAMEYHRTVLLIDADVFKALFTIWY